MINCESYKLLIGKLRLDQDNVGGREHGGCEPEMDMQGCHPSAMTRGMHLGPSASTLKASHPSSIRVNLAGEITVVNLLHGAVRLNGTYLYTSTAYKYSCEGQRIHVLDTHVRS